MSDKDDQPEALIPPGPKLEFREREPEKAPPVERHRNPQEGEKRKRKKKGRKGRKNAKGVTKPKSSWLEGIGGFLFFGLLFVGLVVHRVMDLELMAAEHLHFTRLVLVGGLYAILLIDAFSTDMIQGLLSLFFPPYAYVYGLLFADAGALRGITMAAVVFLGAEFYFTPEDALAMQAYEQVQDVVRKGQGLILDEPRREAGFE